MVASRTISEDVWPQDSLLTRRYKMKTCVEISIYKPRTVAINFLYVRTQVLKESMPCIEAVATVRGICADESKRTANDFHPQAGQSLRVTMETNDALYQSWCDYKAYTCFFLFAISPG